MYIKINSNSKLSQSTGYMFGHFSLPAIQTCPSAGACKIGCYATQGRYKFSNVQKSYAENLELTRDIERFKETIRLEIEALQRKATKIDARLAIRVHTSGDFYSPDYFDAWVDLSFEFPYVKFYAYTKRVELSRTRLRPFNFTIILSEGGIEDGSIQSTDRHARIFSSREELIEAGYDDASHDDSVAFTSQSGLIGLVYHGAPRRAFKTAG